MKRTYTVFLFVFLFACSLSPQMAHAQLENAAVQGSVLVPSPQFPEPGEQVTLSIDDYTINTNGAKITWFVDGEYIESQDNNRGIVVTAGTLGTTKTVTAITTLPSGARLTASYTLTPMRVDMLIEADTLTPAFYKGRALPSSGSPVRVTAVPFTGQARSPESYSYKWTVGSDIAGGGSHFGKNSVTFSSGFEKSVKVSVDVMDSNGGVITKKTIYVPIIEPELHFYEINPLRGMSEIAIGRNYIFVGDEVRVRAEPYYMSSNLLSQDPHREWKIEGRTANNPSADPQEITLRKEGDRGSFTLEFHIRNLRQLLQGVKDSVTINF